MKKELLFIAMIAITAIMAACDNDASEVKPITPLFSSNNSGNLFGDAVLEGQGIGKAQSSGSSVGFSYSGQGSSNMIDNFRIEVSSFGSYESTDEFKLTGGNFDIISGNDRLYGSITGSGHSNGPHFTSTSLWEIQGGTGEFEEAWGTLKAEVSSNAIDGNTAHLYLSGRIVMGGPAIENQ